MTTALDIRVDTFINAGGGGPQAWALRGTNLVTGRVVNVAGRGQDALREATRRLVEDLRMPHP
jgi:hypothetical protein